MIAKIILIIIVLHLQETGAYDQAIDELISIAKGLFDAARCDENGNPVMEWAPFTEETTTATTTTTTAR